MDEIPGDTTTLNMLCTLSMDVASAINAHPNSDPLSTLQQHHYSSYAAARLPAHDAPPSAPAFVRGAPDAFAYKKRARTDLHTTSETRRQLRQIASRNASNLLAAPRIQSSDHDEPQSLRLADAQRLASDPAQPRSLPHAAWPRAQEEEQLAVPVVHMSDLDTSSASSATAPAYLAGPLRKRCRNTKLFVRRYFVLKASMLFNYKSRWDRLPTWKLNLAGAVVGLMRSSLRIVIMLDGMRRVVLLADCLANAEKWTCALAHAADSNASLASTPERMRSRHSKDAARQSPVRVSGGPYAAQTDAPDPDTWDSFRSLAMLDIRTRQKRLDEFGGRE